MGKKSNFLVSVQSGNSDLIHCEFNELPDCLRAEFGEFNISIYVSENTIVAKTINENIVLIFSGNIYQDDFNDDISIGDCLLEKYLLQKNDFVKYLNGSFCLAFINKDTGEIYFATDRLNTRKLFYYHKNNALLFSTDIKYLPVRDCEISSSGLSSYLINGAIYNNITVFKDINILERASLHRVINNTIISEKYWDYNFTNEYVNDNESELSNELMNLYLQSIRRRIGRKKKIFISLSGGYDSRGIAGMVKEISGSNQEIVCLSHNFGKEIKETDAGIAQEVAEKLGLDFLLLKSYEGNPLHTISYNAGYGQGMAYFCVESDAWEKINNEFARNEDSLLLVGDMNDGTFTEFHGNPRRALERTQIYESIFLRDYKNYFSTDILNILCGEWDMEYKKILDDVSKHDEMINLLDYLYVDQRIPHVNSFARECFQMPWIETTTPFYDNYVLDFMMKLPPKLRDNKKLHRIALENKYPELFKIKLATKGWGNESLWIHEIKKFSDDFINDIRNSDSMLDDWIPPDLLNSSILELKKDDVKRSEKSSLKNLHILIKKIFPGYHKLLEIVPGGKELTRKAGNYISPRISHILPKILILRLFLKK